MGKICGMDVSYAQGSINWEQVKASKKIEFAILRAGYGRETSQVDTQFERTMPPASGWAFQLAFTGTAMPLLPPKQNRKRKFACKRFGESSLNIRLRSTSKSFAAFNKPMPSAPHFALHWKMPVIIRRFIHSNLPWKVISVRQSKIAMIFFCPILAYSKQIMLGIMDYGSTVGRAVFQAFLAMWIWIMLTRIIQP